MSSIVALGKGNHEIFVRRDPEVCPEDGKWRVVIVPAIDGVALYPPIREAGADTLEELAQMLGKWNVALANLDLG
ncbi:MAG: hypothetical protein ABII21_01015 [bacterium]